jgi:hypothetical protein
MGSLSTDNETGMPFWPSSGVTGGKDNADNFFRIIHCYYEQNAVRLQGGRCRAAKRQWKKCGSARVFKCLSEEKEGTRDEGVGTRLDGEDKSPLPPFTKGGTCYYFPLCKRGILVLYLYM